MENYCAFSQDHTCLKWLDYVVMLWSSVFVTLVAKNIIN